MLHQMALQSMQFMAQRRKLVNDRKIKLFMVQTAGFSPVITGRKAAECHIANCWIGLAEVFDHQLVDFRPQTINVLGTKRHPTIKHEN
jgi:hypothetical protein